MHNDLVKKTPDVLGMKMPAAVSLLDAAGISYHKEILRPVKKQEEPEDPAAPYRVVRQKSCPDGSVILFVCRIPDTISDTGER